jgi:hypothetical protein
MTIPVQFNSRSFKPIKIIIYARPNPTSQHVYNLRSRLRTSSTRCASVTATGFRSALCQPADNHA